MTPTPDQQNPTAPPPVMTSDQIMQHVDSVYQGLPDPVKQALDHAHALTGGSPSTSVGDAAKPSPFRSLGMVAGGPDQAASLLAHATPSSSVAPPPTSDPAPMIPHMIGVHADAPTTADAAPPPVEEPLPLGGPSRPNPMVPNAPTPATHMAEFNRLTAPPLPAGDPNAHTKLDTGLPGVGQIHNSVGRGFATVADAIASGLFPRIGQFIPSTSEHHQLLVNQQRGALGEEQAGAKSAADTAKSAAETKELGARGAEETARGNALANPPDPKEWTQVTEPIVDPAHPENGPQVAYVNKNDPTKIQFLGKAAAKPTEDKITTSHVVAQDGSVIAIHSDPKTGKTTHEIVYKGDPKVNTELTKLEVNGKPHTVVFDKNTNKVVQDLGETGEKPPTVNVNAESHQEQMKGKELLDKAEGQYRTAVQGANTLTDFVKSAQAGNKVTAQALPLEGALEITTTAGTKRINRTEVENYAGAGSLYDKILGKIGKLTAGQPIPKDVQDDSVKLAKILQSNAYKTYKDAHTSAVKRYGLKDEEPLPEPGGGTTAYVENGTQYDIPADKVAAFEAKHPNAKKQ